MAEENIVVEVVAAEAAEPAASKPNERKFSKRRR